MKEQNDFIKKGNEIQKTQDPEYFPPHVCKSDGLVYFSNPPQYKCGVCGKFSFNPELV